MKMKPAETNAAMPRTRFLHILRLFAHAFICCSPRRAKLLFEEPSSERSLRSLDRLRRSSR